MSAAARALSNALGRLSAEAHLLAELSHVLRDLASHVPCASPAAAQAAADAAGLAATRLGAEGKEAESAALRGVSREVLEGLLAEWAPPAQGLRRSRHLSIFEQLAVRSLEAASPRSALGPNDTARTHALRAAEVALSGASEAARGGNVAAAKRFEMVASLAKLHVEAGAAGAAPQPLFSTVERRGRLSPKEFYDGFSSCGLPVVLESRHCVPRAWGFDDLAKLCGERELKIQRHDPNSRVWAGMLEYAEETLEQLLHRWSEGDREGVVFDEPLALACPSLLGRWRWPACVEEGDLVRRSPVAGMPGSDPFCGHPSLFVQPAGSQCGVHVDSFRSQFAQAVLCGRKRWSFWPLSEVDQLRHFGRRDQVRLEIHRRRRISRVIHFEQSFPPAEERALLGPHSGTLEELRVDVDVGPGETILVPGGMPHRVLNLEDTVAVSQNFVDAAHASRAAAELRWPVPYDELASFLEDAAASAPRASA